MLKIFWQKQGLFVTFAEDFKSPLSWHFSNQLMDNQIKHLLHNLKQGDEKAFEAIYEAYYQNLVDFVLFFINDEFCAQEVVNEFFADFWAKRKEIKIKANLAGYLYQSVKNRLFTRLKAKNKFPQGRIIENLDAEESLTPERMLVIKEQNQKVENILSLIPKRSREIFVMHKFDKLKYKEIAELLEISPKTVENHIMKAMKILRDYYANH